MRKSKETIVKEYNGFQVVNYYYYFDDPIECINYKFDEDERVLSRHFSDKGIFAVEVENIQLIKKKNIIDTEEYKNFVNKLRELQQNFNYTEEWYNNWIDYINKKSYEEAYSLLQLINLML